MCAVFASLGVLDFAPVLIVCALLVGVPLVRFFDFGVDGRTFVGGCTRASEGDPLNKKKC